VMMATRSDRSRAVSSRAAMPGWYRGQSVACAAIRHVEGVEIDTVKEDAGGRQLLAPSDLVRPMLETMTWSVVWDQRKYDDVR
jgi:hypothetical protein